MTDPRWYPFAPHLAYRETVRELEPEYSLLWAWRDRVEQWREQLRPKIVELLGLPQERCGLDIRELGGVDCEGYSRTKLAYNVEDGVGASAWVCVPHDNEEPLPAVVCAHPRGAGKDELVGLVGEAPEDAHAPYAALLAQRGYVTVAPDARCFGERAADEAGLAAVGDLLGRPLLGMQVWDLLRAVDYLAQRPDVRADRIGITGLGMGATQGIFAAAVDTRIACAAVCGGLSTYRELIVAGNCFNGSPPPRDILTGLLRWADIDDVACLIAPRPLAMAHGREDGTTPLAGAKELLERVQSGYQAQGEKIKVETELAQGGHAYHEDFMFRFLDDWLKLPGPGGGRDEPDEQDT